MCCHGIPQDGSLKLVPLSHPEEQVEAVAYHFFGIILFATELPKGQNKRKLDSYPRVPFAALHLSPFREKIR